MLWIHYSLDPHHQLNLYYQSNGSDRAHNLKRTSFHEIIQNFKASWLVGKITLLLQFKILQPGSLCFTCRKYQQNVIKEYLTLTLGKYFILPMFLLCPFYEQLIFIMSGNPAEFIILMSYWNQASCYLFIALLFLLASFPNSFVFACYNVYGGNNDINLQCINFNWVISLFLYLNIYHIINPLPSETKIPQSLSITFAMKCLFI